jgi:RNA polymerase sigma factor (sigma-70 family)
MSDTNEFHHLLQRARDRDAGAAVRLIEEYEPEIRRIARVRLSGTRLRQTLDSNDICQSVLGNFFVRLAAGQFDLETPEQLMALLAKMTRNKVNDKHRREHTQKREPGTNVGGDSVLAQLAGPGTDPSEQAAARELLARAERLFDPEERYLIEQRGLGRGWDELAEELKTSHEALRKCMSRARERVARELGLEGPDSA